MSRITLEDRPVLERLMAGWAYAGGEIAEDLFGHTGPLRFKEGTEAITVADGRIETLLRGSIAEHFPGDLIRGEEGGESGGSEDSARVWYLDPIDGTMNYALGLPGYCLSIALVENGQPVAACIYQPATGDLFTATLGHGTCRNGHRVKVSGRVGLGNAMLSTQLKNKGRVVQNPLLLQALMNKAMKTRHIGAIALELAWVAAGCYDAMVASFAGRIHRYDVAAGLLLVTEAGGTVLGFAGEPYALGGPELLAGSPVVCGELVDLMRGHLDTDAAGGGPGYK